MAEGKRGKRRSPARWSIRLHGVILELSERGVSDNSIVAVLAVYEGMDVTLNQVRRFRRNCKISKPMSESRKQNARRKHLRGYVEGYAGGGDQDVV